MRGVGWTELGVEVVPGPVCQSTLLSSWWTRKYERGRMDGVGCGGCPWPVYQSTLLSSWWTRKYERGRMDGVGCGGCPGTRMSVYSTKFLVDKEV